jgi:ribonuclease BN (tRNA processing enzyme)
MIGDDGVYAYLASYLSGGSTTLDVREVLPGDSQTVFDEAGIRITSIHVPHGIVPAVAFRVVVDDVSIVFASDQNGSDDAFIAFAGQADLLVMHLPIPESAEGIAVQLHAKPSTVGSVARRADVKQLLVSHFMARSLADARSVPIVEEMFGDNVDVAVDLLCLPLAAEDASAR